MAAAAAGLAASTFIPYYNHLLTILDTNDEMKRSARGIFRQVGYAALGTAAGGVLGGPVGAMVGGFIGSYYGYATSDNYQAMVTVLQNLSDEEKEIITRKVQELVGSAGLEELVRFIGSQMNRELLLNILRDSLKNRSDGHRA